VAPGFRDLDSALEQRLRLVGTVHLFRKDDQIVDRSEHRLGEIVLLGDAQRLVQECAPFVRTRGAKNKALRVERM